MKVLATAFLALRVGAMVAGLMMCVVFWVALIMDAPLARSGLLAAQLLTLLSLIVLLSVAEAVARRELRREETDRRLEAAGIRRTHE